MIKYFNTQTSVEDIAAKYDAYSMFVTLKSRQPTLQTVIRNDVIYIAKNVKLLTKYEQLLLEFCSGINNYRGRIANDNKERINYGIVEAITANLKIRKDTVCANFVTGVTGHVLWNKNQAICRIDVMLYKKLKTNNFDINEYHINDFCTALQHVNDKLYSVAHNYIQFI